MLNDYIKAYNKAKAENNTKEMKRLQRDLLRLGVDLMTLEVLAKEFANERS